MGKKYLQLTYLGKDAYQDDDEVILLNKRCLSYQEIAELDTLGFRCLDYPSELTDMDKLSVVWDDFYHRICVELSRVLSKFHGIEHNEKYWEYFLSYDFPPVLLLYYERYISIKEALKLCPDIWIKVYMRDAYYLAEHSIWDAENLDQFVQVIDAQILHYFEYPYVEYVMPTESFKENVQKKEDTNIIKAKIRTLINDVYRMFSRKDEFYITYNFAHGINSLRLKTIGKAYFAENEMPRIDDSCNINKQARNIIQDGIIIECNNEFEKVFVNYLYANLSKLYIEAYKELLNSNRKFYYITPKYYIKNFYNPLAMEYGASIREAGGVVVNCAHSVEESFRYRHIISKTDELSDLTLEWSEAELFAQSNSIECISGMIENAHNIDYLNNRLILYVFSCAQGRHNWSRMGIITRSRVTEKNLVDRIRDLYENLNSQNQEWFCFRNRDEWNWGVADYIYSIDNNISIDDSFKSAGGVGFAEKVEKARLVVTDNIHSSIFFQSLLYGVPTFIIDNENYSGLLSDAFLQLIDELREVDVVVTDGKKMAQIINDHYYDIDSWWNEEHRQTVIKRVIEAVWCRNKTTSVYDWWKEKMSEIRERTNK